MNYPPPLTWMHLVPRELPLVTAGAPDWLAASVARHAGAAQRDAVGNVAAAASVEAAIRSHGDAGAIVAVNAPSGAAAALKRAGFAHVTRFAVLPNLREARWFIPLDSPRAAAASFSVYTPSKRSAILRRAAARAAARLGIGGWYGDEVLVARRQSAPLEDLLRETLGTRDLCLALSAGAPEPALNRKCSVAAITPRGQLLAFAKVAAGPLATGLVANEHRVLRSLASGAAEPGSVPESLFGGTCGGNFTLIQRPLSGRPAGKEFGPAHQRFLRSLVGGPSRPLLASRLVADILRRGDALGDRAGTLRPLLDDLAIRGATTLAPAATVHGDFAPWNLLIADGGLRAFDWEYGNEDGLPVLDETNHRLQVAHLLDDWSVERTADALEAAARGRDDFAPDVARLLQRVCLLDTTTRLLTEGYDLSNRMVAWYADLARRLAPGPTLQAVSA